ncbi:MAG: peptidase [Gemmatimonadetes bacterium]|nr:peptidase [Gemmatimonadota bacterium]
MRFITSFPRMTELSATTALTARLMEIDSTSGAEGDVIDFMQRYLDEQGWCTTRIPVSEGRDDVFASAGEPRDVRVTLSTHLDTVPPYIAPRVAGDRLLGRGACDAKGIAAAMVMAGERLRASGVPVGLLFVVGEETAHDGAHAANAWMEAMGSTNRVIINGEPTESTLALGTKGAKRYTVRVQGEAAHSAYPQLGRSATLELARLLVDLERVTLPTDALLGDTTINIGFLSGGVADNVVAPWAEARIMARLVTSQEELQPVLAKWVKGRASINSDGIMVPPVKLGVVEGFATSVAAFATDIPALGAWGTPYLYGPGSIHVAHRDDEFVVIAELESAVDAYEKLAILALEQDKSKRH